MMSLVRAQFGEPTKRDPKPGVSFCYFLGAGLDGNNGKAVVIELRSNSYELRRGTPRNTPNQEFNQKDPKFRVFFYSFLGAGLDGNNGRAVVIELRSNSYEPREGVRRGIPEPEQT